MKVVRQRFLHITNDLLGLLVRNRLSLSLNILWLGFYYLHITEITSWLLGSKVYLFI